MTDLLVRFKLDDKGLDAQMKGVSSKFAAASKAIGAIALPVAAIGFIAKTVEGLSQIGERAIEAAGSLQDTSQQLGVTAERLQELRLVAKNAGVEVETFDKSLSILNRGLGQAALGQGNLEKVAKSAGLAIRDEQGHIKATAVVWDDLTKLIQSGALSQNQAIGLASAAFGRGGGQMVQVLRQTAEEQQKVIDTARQFGAILSNELVAAADQYVDELELIKKGTEAIGVATDMMWAPLTLKWALLKNEIAGATLALADFLGVVDGGAQLQDRQLKQLEETIQAHREYLEVTKHPDPTQDALLQKLVADWTELKNKIDEAKKAAAEQNAKPIGGGATDDEGVEVDDPEEARAKKAAADYELALITAVYEEQDRLALEQQAKKAQRAKEEAQLNIEWATVMAEERERVAAEEAAQLTYWAETMAIERERVFEEELAQIQEWNETLAAERDNAASMEIEQYLAKEGMLTQARKEGMEARLAFEQMEAGQKVATTIGALTKITAAVAQHSKKAFELNKLAAIANAIVNTAQGATKALAQGGFAGIAMAAAVAAAGAVQIAAIRKTQYQGGGMGTTPSAVGTTPVVNDQPVPNGGAGGTGFGSVIRVEGLDSGALFDGKAVRALLQRLQDAQKDGARLVIAG